MIYLMSVSLLESKFLEERIHVLLKFESYWMPMLIHTVWILFSYEECQMDSLHFSLKLYILYKLYISIIL